MVEKVFAVLIQYRRVTDRHPATQPFRRSIYLAYYVARVKIDEEIVSLLNKNECEMVYLKVKRNKCDRLQADIDVENWAELRGLLAALFARAQYPLVSRSPYSIGDTKAHLYIVAK